MVRQQLNQGMCCVSVEAKQTSVWSEVLWRDVTAIGWLLRREQLGLSNFYRTPPTRANPRQASCPRHTNSSLKGISFRRRNGESFCRRRSGFDARQRNRQSGRNLDGFCMSVRVCAKASGIRRSRQRTSAIRTAPLSQIRTIHVVLVKTRRAS